MLSPLVITDKERGSPLHRLAGRLIILQIHLLICDRPPPPFHTDVVECPSSPVQTHLAPRCCPPPRTVETGALCALRTVENSRLSPLQSVVPVFQTKAHVHGDRHRP